MTNDSARRRQLSAFLRAPLAALVPLAAIAFALNVDALPSAIGAACTASGLAGGCASLCCGANGTCAPYADCNQGNTGAPVGAACAISGELGNCASLCCHSNTCSPRSVCFGIEPNKTKVIPTHYENPELPWGSACDVTRHDDCASHCCFEGKCLSPEYCGSPVTPPIGQDLDTTCKANSDCKSQCCNKGTCSYHAACFGEVAEYIPPLQLDPTFQPLSIRVLSATEWCLMFPTDWQVIGDHEFEAGILCSPALVEKSGGRLPAAPKDIVPKAWFGTGTDGKGNTWVQMAGKLNKGYFTPGDTGGQYDSDGEPVPSDPNRGAPRGSNCAGHDHYVQLMNPSLETFCLRCCTGPDAAYICNFRYSGMGCDFVFPGIQLSD